MRVKTLNEIITLFTFFIILTGAQTHNEHTFEWAIELAPGEDVRHVCQKYGLIHIGKVANLERIHLVTLNNNITKRSINLNKIESGGVLREILWVEKQVPIKVVKRKMLESELKLPYKDPLLPRQWHLHNLTEPTGHVHINVLPVWNMGITGKGVVIAFVDDGVEYEHPDLKPNWLPGAGNWNFNLRSSDVRPQNFPNDWHGTAVTGLAVSYPNNTLCGVGVAPNAKFTAIVLLQSDLTHTDSTAAQALCHEHNLNDIFSNSWGPEDNGQRLGGPGILTKRAIKDSILNGRRGLGSIYTWAAGNGRKFKDNCNYDGYANSRYVATFGAIDHNGVATEYTEPCSSLLGVLPSGSLSRTMLTTEIFDASIGSCGKNFAGTSAAAPLAAGIAALLLEANQNITWLDFQYIIKTASFRNDPSHPSWRQNKAGFWTSHLYGFGIVNAHLATLIALNWTNSIEEISFTKSSKQNETHYGPSILLRIPIEESITVHHVELTVDIEYGRRGNLEIRLFSPNGTESILAEQHDDLGVNYNNWTFSTIIPWGEKSVGNWKLSIKGNSLFYPNIFLKYWELAIYGISDINDYPILLHYFNNLSVTWPPPVIPNEPPQTDQTTWKVALMSSLIAGAVIAIFLMILFIALKKSKNKKLKNNESEKKTEIKDIKIDKQESPPT